MEKINLQQDDATIYKKAKSRVILRLVFSYLFLIVYFIAVYFILHIDFLQISQSQLSDPLLLVLSLGQLVLYLILFLMLASGSKIFRIFYWICFVFEICTILIPGYYLMQDIRHFLIYAVLMGCMLIKLSFLYSVGHALGSNRWCRIVFDYVIEVDEDEIEEEDDDIFEPIRVQSSTPSYEEEIEDDDEEEEEKLYTLPQISVRLGIVVYGSLMVFPILVQIFASFFVSNDLKTVFATKDIFILSMVSAVIWTIPVFFLYYSHPYSRRIVLGCILAEIVSTLAYTPKFIGYILSGEYPIRVFIFFILVDILRYILLFFALKPISQVNGRADS